MKTILCYGDSITWGSNPDAAGMRHAREDRWPEVMRKTLGPDYHIMAEGLRGRSTAYSVNTADCERNGAAILPTLLYTHAPLDLVILMLGTNDLQTIVCGKAVGAQMGMRRLVEIVRNHAPRIPDQPAPRVMIVAPPHLVPTETPFYADLFEGMIAQSQKIGPYYAELAAELGVPFFDAARVATASAVDGVHLDAANTRAIGAALAPVVRAILAD